MKRGKIILLSLLFLILGFQLFFYFQKPNVLFGPSDIQAVDIQIRNLAPTILSVDDVPSNVVLLAGTTSTVTFNFTAQDLNGAADMVLGNASITLDGEQERINDSCVVVLTVGKTKTFNCNVDMEYYDSNEEWTVTVRVTDLNGLGVSNSSKKTTPGLLKDISLSPQTIVFGQVDPGEINKTFNEINITNNGNFETLTDGVISIIALDLIGQNDPLEIISAESFRIDDISNLSSVCASGIQLINNTLVETNIILPRYDGADIETSRGIATLCIPLVPEISAQSYLTIEGGSWEVKI
jgi:hypothetical protein